MQADEDNPKLPDRSENKNPMANILYEDERLTEDLTDTAARLLLNWSTIYYTNIRQLEGEVFEEAFQNLKKVIRSINQIAGKHHMINEIDMVTRLIDLADKATYLDQPETKSERKQNCEFIENASKHP